MHNRAGGLSAHQDCSAIISELYGKEYECKEPMRPGTA